MPRIQIPCTYRSRHFKIEIKANEAVSSLRSKIASNLNNIESSKILLYLSNQKLTDDQQISDLKIDKNSIQVVLSLKPLNKRKIHITTKVEENKILFLKREMKVIISNSDNINAVLAAQSILDCVFQSPISDILAKSVHCPYICSYIFNLFKSEIAKTIEKKEIIIVFNECSDLKLVGHILNYLSEVNEEFMLNFIHSLQLNERFFKLLEHLNFANKPQIIKKIVSKILKYKGDLAAIAPYLIIFFNNFSIGDKEFFQNTFQQIRDIKRSKYKNSPEVRMLLLAISAKCDKIQDTLKRYEKLLNISIEKPKLTKAVLSTVHLLFLLSKKKDQKFIDRETIYAILHKIPHSYEQEDFIHYLLQASLDETPDIFKEDESKSTQNPKFSKILEFSFTHNFHLILKSQLVKETFLTNTFSWLANGINYMQVFKMIYDSNPDFPSAINGLFLLYSASCPTISSSTFSPSPKTYLHHHSYYPSQLVDSIFYLLTMFVDILPKNESMIRVDSRYIFEFSFLFLLRPDLSLQKSALKVIKKVGKFKNNDDLPENFVSDIERRSKKRNSLGVTKERDNGLYKVLLDQLNDNSFSDLTESNRIIRGALCYFIKSPSFFRDDVFNIALVTSGHSLAQKLKYLQDLQKQQLKQLQDHLRLQKMPRESSSQDSEEDQNSNKPASSKPPQKPPSKLTPNQQQNQSQNQQQNSKKSKTQIKIKPSQVKPQPNSNPVTPAAPLPTSSFESNSILTSQCSSSTSIIDELSYSYIFLKILSDQIQKNFDVYVPFIKNRLEFTSIAFSFLSFGGNKSHLRESFLSFVSDNINITNDEKLEILFRFIQNERKLEHKQKRQSDSSILKMQEPKGSKQDSISQLSVSADQINSEFKHRLSISNSNLDSSNYEREMNLVFRIMKSFKGMPFTNFSSDYFSIQKYSYLYIISQMTISKLFKNCVDQLLPPKPELFSNTKGYSYEIIRFVIFSILFSLNDKDASFVFPQLNSKSIYDFLRKQNHENKKFFKTIFRCFLVNNSKSLKKGIGLALSAKSHSRIDFSMPSLEILKDHPKKAIRTLFAILSTQFIEDDVVEEVTEYLKFFLERGYMINSKNITYLAGAKENVLYSLYSQTTDYISPYLPYFMINNIFSLDLWEKIADELDEGVVLQCVVSTFSFYSSYTLNLTYHDEDDEDYGNFVLVTEGCKLAYKLFDIYKVKKSKSWQVICLSLLFNEPNEFALNHLNQIVDDNDKLKKVKKSPISDHFSNLVEELLDDESKVEIISAILEIIPLVRAKQCFNALFEIIQKEKEFDEKEILSAISIYNSFCEKLTASPLLLEFLISKIDDENTLKKLMNNNFPLIRKYSYNEYKNLKSDSDIKLLDKLVKKGKQHYSCLSNASEES